MKKIMTMALVGAAMGLCAPGVSAQSVMNITKNDGSSVIIRLDDIREVTFGEADIESKGIKAVDLGLSSGTLWADCNIGSTTPEGTGWYLAWGELAPHAEGEAYTEDDYSDYYFDEMPATITGTEYDVCKAELGDGWLIPTPDQQLELFLECETAIETLNGVKGVRFTGPNGNSIFFALTGRVTSTDDPNEVGQNMFQWSGERFMATPEGAYVMWLGLNPEDENQLSGTAGLGRVEGYMFAAVPRCTGLTVRAVYVR